MIIASIHDPQFEPQKTKHQWLIQNAVEIGLSVAGFLILSMIGVMILAPDYTPSILGTVLLGLMIGGSPVVGIQIHYFDKDKADIKRRKIYEEHLSHINPKTLIMNYHSPEHNDQTKEAIQQYLNTYHKGWSVPDQVYIEYSDTKDLRSFQTTQHMTV